MAADGLAGVASRPRRIRLPRPRKSENYGDAAFLHELARLIDLVPRRRIVLVVLFAIGAAIIGGLEALYASTTAAGGRIAALELTAAGSLAGWFSSVMLLAAAGLAVIVYTVRRHKINDYHGRYRIWRWAAACWFLMAAVEGAGLHHAWQQWITARPGAGLVGGGQAWWIIPGVFLLGAIGSRLVADMWACRWSTGSLLAAGLCYAAAAAGHLNWIVPEGELAPAVFRTGAAMLGHLMLVLAMGLHARHVILDAEGRLPQRRAKPAADKKGKAAEAKAETTGRKSDLDTVASADEEMEEEPETVSQPTSSSSGNKWTAVHTPHATPQPAFTRPAPAASAAPAKPKPPPAQSSTATSSIPSGSHSGKLNKAERKALRDRLLKERMERERKW